MAWKEGSNTRISDVEPQRHRDVRVNHPTIVATIKNMISKGFHTLDIMRVVGMPQEVINKLRHEMKEDTDAKG